MLHGLRARLSYANVMATLAFFFALTGGAVAGANALITGADIQNGSVTGKDIKNDSLTGKDLRDASIKERDIAPAVIGKLSGVAGEGDLASAVRELAWDTVSAGLMKLPELGVFKADCIEGDATFRFRNTKNAPVKVVVDAGGSLSDSMVVAPNATIAVDTLFADFATSTTQLWRITGGGKTATIWASGFDDLQGRSAEAFPDLRTCTVSALVLMS